MAAPSTAPKNPLAEGLAKVTGLNPLSESAGTASPISYDPDMVFRAPEGDTINITGDPGTGASTSETWSHEIALENLRKSQLEFEYQQQQDVLAEALRQQQLQLSQAESGRAAQQLALSQGQYGIQQAGEKRAAAMAPYQTQSAQLSNQTAQADLVVKQIAADTAARQAAVEAAMRNREAGYMNTAMQQPGMTYSYGGLSPWYTVNNQGVPMAKTPTSYNTGQTQVGGNQQGRYVDPYYKSTAYQPYGGQGGGGQMARYY